MLCDVEPVPPLLSVSVRLTVYVPPAAYVCDGFATVAVAPSPKLQLQPTTVPSASVLVLVKEQASPVQVCVKAAVGGVLGGVTVMLCDVEPVPPLLSVAVRLTVYVPPAAYVCDGFATVAVAPSPKLQLQPTTLPSGSVLVLVKEHASPVQLDVKAAVGGVLGAVTVTLCDVEPVPPLLSVAVRLTVYVPPVAYVCAGFATVAVAPSPKLQLHPTTLPSGSVLVLVKLQASPVQVWVKAAVGGVLGGVTVMLCDFELVVPLLSVTVRLTGYGPPAAYTGPGL